MQISFQTNIKLKWTGAKGYTDPIMQYANIFGEWYVVMLK